MHTTTKGQGQPEAGAKSPAADPATANGKFSLISDEKLIGLYTNLLRCRAMELQLNGNSDVIGKGFLGHEAALVGTAIDLGPGDIVCSPGRGLLTDFSEEHAIEKLLADSGHNGRNGFSNPKAGNGSRAGGSSFAHAAIGTALANKTARNGKIAVVYSAGTDADGLHEAIHVSSVHALPMIFVQQWNGDSARTRSSARKAGRGKEPVEQTPWFPSITVDTHDVVAVYRVANEAISRARLGRGPTLIECRPYLLGRNTDKQNGRHSGDPVLNMEHYLRAKGLFDPKLKSAAAVPTPKR
jgi:pyruvate dehydrogenase E1 component alpha subunit